MVKRVNMDKILFENWVVTKSGYLHVVVMEDTETNKKTLYLDGEKSVFVKKK